MERTYLKTLAVVDVAVEEDGGVEGGDDGGVEGAATGGAPPRKRKMALVHWWYHPSSYDEWMSAEDVSAEVETEEHPGMPGGPAVVGCKFVRDVERFNEWGVEADYAVMEYERKIAYLRRKETASASSKKSGKSNKRSRSREAKQQTSSETLTKAEEPAAKKKKNPQREDSDAPEADVALPERAPASPTATLPKKSKSKPSSPTKIHVREAAVRQMSDRRSVDSGMNPRRILTGVRGVRNEVLRRTVHDGALRVGDEAHAVIRDALQDYMSGGIIGKEVMGREPTLNARPEWRKLLPPTGFIRPSVDTKLKYMTAMELTLEEAGPLASEGEGGAKTVAVQRSVPILFEASAEMAGAAGGEDPLSVRGGGLEEEASGAQPNQQEELPPQQEEHQEGRQPQQQDEIAMVSNPPEMNPEAGSDEAEMVVEMEVDAETEVQVEVETELGAWPAQPQPSTATKVSGDHPTPVAGDDGNDAERTLEDQTAAANSDEIVQQLEPKGVAMQLDGADPPAPAPVPAPAPSGTDVDTVQEEQTVDLQEEVSTTEPSKEDSNEDHDGGLLTVAAVEGAPKAQPPKTEPAAAESPATAEAGAKEEVACSTSLSSDVDPMAVDTTSDTVGQGNTTVVVADNTVRAEATSLPMQENHAPVEEAKTTSGVVFTVQHSLANTAADGESTMAASSTVPPSDSSNAASKTLVAPPVTTAATTIPAPLIAESQILSMPIAPTVTKATTITTTASPSAPSQTTAASMETKAPEVSTAMFVSTAASTATSATATTTESQMLLSASAEVQFSAPVNTVSTTKLTNNEQAVISQVVSLPAGTQLSASLHRPPPAPSAEQEAKDDTITRPSWYCQGEASQLERRSLPEWFNSSAPHRTSESYTATREKILHLARRNGQQFITSTAIRRSVPGDAGSLLRLHRFLMDWGLLNGGQINETAPGDSVLRGSFAEGGALSSAATSKFKRKYADVERSAIWSTERMQRLELSVIKHVSKKTETMDGGSSQVKMAVDWNAVAMDVGGDVSAEDCQRAFLEPPSENAKMIADASASSHGPSTFSRILNGVRPEVLKAAFDASLGSTEDISEARKASFVAGTASAAAQMGAKAESEVELTLLDIVDQRLQRLENRVALMDDVEALLEAERVSLELERRDMYTARCRHWFGDGSS
mmetsp:Transcript_24133/g.58299  ORF Transcript_24133/g.58299 Transcript_24133/m.58299 type:complete len:1162 (+) Transcript_24133:1-3486(+)